MRSRFTLNAAGERIGKIDVDEERFPRNSRIMRQLREPGLAPSDARRTCTCTGPTRFEAARIPGQEIDDPTNRSLPFQWVGRCSKQYNRGKGIIFFDFTLAREEIKSP